MTKDDDDYRKELADAHVSAHHRLSKQSVGFVGANRYQETDLGLSGIPLDFDAGAPACTKSHDDPVGCHTTPAIGGDVDSLSISPDGDMPSLSSSVSSSPAIMPLSSPVTQREGESDEEKRVEGHGGKHEA